MWRRVDAWAFLADTFVLFDYSAHSSALKMEAVSSSETLADINQTTHPGK
jgi:hypothetical protein